MKIFARRSMREMVRPLYVLGIRTLSSSGTPDVDQGLVLRYLDKVKRRSEALQSVQGTRLSTEDASFMRRYRTLQPYVEKLDATLAEKEELRELMLSEEVGRRQTSEFRPSLPLCQEIQDHATTLLFVSRKTETSPRQLKTT